MMDARTKRWKAVAVYRSEGGPVDVEHDIEELSELQDLIERGPHWSALVDIRVTLQRPTHTCQHVRWTADDGSIICAKCGLPEAQV